MREFDFSQKRILVTGASSGIGRQISIDCIGDGCKELIGVGRNLDRLIETKGKAVTADNFIPHVFDLTEIRNIAALVKQLPMLDGIVLNAGIAEILPTRFLTEVSLRKIFSSNLDSNICLLAELQKAKKIQAGASIVLMSSISSKLGVVGTGSYAASKSALSAFGRVLASELSARKIRVNSILPGLISTELIDGQSSVSQEDMHLNAKKYPLGIGRPEDVSNLVGYLLSDLSAWITGNEFILDGGFLLT